MKLTTKQINETWKLFILENTHGMKVHILNLGGIITKIIVPDKNGIFENVVLGYKDYRHYQEDSNYFGAIIGQVAGRIKESRFELDGISYELERNDGTNHLHGGTNGFHNLVWDAKPFETPNDIGVKLSYNRKDGEYGYPGNLKVAVTYSLNDDNQLFVDYHATTDKMTPITLTNHTYFNLTGNLKDTVVNHQVKMNSHHYLELDHKLAPTGKVRDTMNTVFDFTHERKLEDGVVSSNEQNHIVGKGYDHYFLFDRNAPGHVEVKDAPSGRMLTITTDQPGMVMYTANNLEEGLELTEGISKKYLGVCFETQGSPACLHHCALPSIVLNADEVYGKQTVYSFGVMGDDE